MGGIKNLPDEIYAEPLASASRTLIIPEYLSRKDKNNQMKVHKGPPSSFSTFQPQNTDVHIPLKSKHHLDSNIVYGNDPVSEYDYNEYLYDYEYPYQSYKSFKKEPSYQRNVYLRTPHDFQGNIQTTFSKNVDQFPTADNHLSDQFIFPNQYVISEPDSGSTRYDRRLIIKLPANQPPDTAMDALGIQQHSQGHHPSTYQNIIKYGRPLENLPQRISRPDFVSNFLEDPENGTWGGSSDWVEKTDYRYY